MKTAKILILLALAVAVHTSFLFAQQMGSPGEVANGDPKPQKEDPDAQEVLDKAPKPESSLASQFGDALSSANDWFWNQAEFVNDYWSEEFNNINNIAQKYSAESGNMPGVKDGIGDAWRHTQANAALVNSSEIGWAESLAASNMNDLAGLVTQPFQGVPLSEVGNGFLMDVGNNAAGWWQGMTGLPASSFPSYAANVGEASVGGAFLGHFQNLGYYLGTF